MLLLDTHVLHWSSADPSRISRRASVALEEANELVVAAISWWELAWLARHDRIIIEVPVRSWLERLSAQVRTVDATPAIADTATALPASFPGDPADRLIFATAVELGIRLVTRDRAIRAHPHPREVAIW